MTDAGWPAGVKALREVSRVLQDPETTGISDTIWYNETTTLVEFCEMEATHIEQQAQGGGE
jgi:hypothetical protein